MYYIFVEISILTKLHNLHIWSVLELYVNSVPITLIIQISTPLNYESKAINVKL